MGWAIAAQLAGAILPMFAKPKETTTRTNFKQLRSDAEKAGFNPLTALRATGGAGNTTTTHPALSSAEFLGNALGAVGEIYDPMKLERERLEVGLMQAELDRMKGTAYGAPALGGGYARQDNRLDDYSNPSDRLGAPSAYTASGYNWMGFHLSPNPWNSDGEVYENRSGDLWGSLMALPNQAMDVGYTIGSRARDWVDNRAFSRAVASQYRPQPPKLSTYDADPRDQWLNFFAPD